jgi:hypothetical protein
LPALREGKAVTVTANRSKWFWMALLVSFIMVSFFLESAAAIRDDHVCINGDCPICLLIQRAENFCRQLKGAAFYPGFSVTALLTAVFILKFVVFCFVPLSAVQLKVKMNR